MPPLSRGELSGLHSRLTKEFGDSCASQLVMTLETSTLVGDAPPFLGFETAETSLLKLCPSGKDTAELQAVAALLVWLRTATATDLSDAAVAVQKTQLGELRAKLEDDEAWSFPEYKQKLAELSELKDLLTTPFMLEIVVQILPRLSGRSASLGSIKAHA